uniref:NADH-ubiquinone oxidoreductase chain 5 n=1 Tax=Trigonopterus sp. 1 AH-2016 TaxID=1903835 RepID=A0A343C5D0_9CUCU|nr:NADH dehydrogenase subunit 5 [Trigonopterus sp. 1 AH-2016]
MFLCMFFFLFFSLVSIIFYILGLFFLYSNFSVLVEHSFCVFNSVNVELSLYVDWVSLMFLSFVFFISSMIMVYSSSYMENEKNFNRFIYLMFLFVFSMMVVIMSSNLVFLLLGWDGLGLVSYALVIYYQNVKSLNAGMITVLSNRIGDSALLLGIVFMMDTGSWNFQGVMNFSGENSSKFLLGLLILLASFTKSAQIPFSAWLPAAMAAPTPVSSLVHSSTLVTAGVYLLFRFSDLLSEDVKNFFLFFSLFTMFMAGVAANLEFDLKKIIALSTLSQLGMMMVIYFCGSKDLAFFHLIIHALFKALLFMCSGLIIHSFMGSQDIRFMGGLVKFFPITSSCFCVSNMALCGFPFLSGFYSKDLVAEVFSMNISSMIIFIFFFLSIGLTVSYSMRLILYVFIGQFNFLTLSMLSEESNKVMVKSMVGLVLLVIFKGSLIYWVGFSTPYFVVLPLEMKFLTLVMIFFGVVLGFEFYKLGSMYFSSMMSVHQILMFFSGMWNLPILSLAYFNPKTLLLGKLYMKSMDLGWAEFYGSKGLFFFIQNLTQIFQLFSRNHLKLYLFIVWGFIFFFFLVFI